MSPRTSRSEQVIERYKREKLAASALRKIHDLIQGFEQDRADDARFARIGMAILVVLLGIAMFYFFANETVTLS